MDDLTDRVVISFAFNSDTLAKYEILKKSMNEKGKDVAVRFLLKKQIILDPHAEITDEIERTLLFYQVHKSGIWPYFKTMVLHCSSFNFSYSLYLLQQAHSDIISGRLPSSEQEARLFAATKCQFDLGDFDPAVSIEDKL